MKWTWVLITVLFYSCHGQGKNKTTMEKFDITAFNTHQSGGEYLRTLDDGTVISQFGDSAGYFEKSFPSKGWFYGYKEFYGDGELKLEGELFKKGEFQAGTWKEFDERGRQQKETNYDAQYKMDIDAIFKILRQKNIPFLMTDSFNTVRRGVVDGKGLWIVEWKTLPDRIERMQIDDSTGKIIKQDFYTHQENN